ncbi:hypothetical protein [Enterococcus casseliflavus]|uniref:hypothetical protein n=1 Tax=Enterococcus casseliflavus TaxID=37734 RepID=UPI00232AFC5E|nr:hypothetical protein [Enterococcus casseliflavus]MDB1688324.1 hypothetical protein [Enterococcus casseliflavus]
MSYMYRCIKSFSIQQLDALEENETGKGCQIVAGSNWQREKPIKKTDTEVYLTEEDGKEIVIEKALFDLMFEKVEVRKIDDDTVSIQMNSTDLVALSEALAFCDRSQYPKIDEAKSAQSKITDGLYILLAYVD